MPSNLSAHSVLLAQNFWESSASPKHAIGQRGETEDGRVFRYAQAGLSALAAGNVLQSPAIVALHLALTAPVTAVGQTVFTCTPGATLGTADQYADGYLTIDTTPDVGKCYRIKGHPAFASATAFTLTLDDPIGVAWSTATRFGLVANKYRGVIQMPVTTATGRLVGVAPYIIAASEYGWIQTWGPACVLIAGTPALGAMVLAPGAVAGAAEIMTTTNLVVAQLVGNMLQVGVNTKSNAVDLRISP